MNRMVVVSALALAGLLAVVVVIQQRRLDRLESAVNRTQPPPEGAADPGGGAGAFAVRGDEGSRAAGPQVKFVPVPVPVPVAVGTAAAPGAPAAAAAAAAAATAAAATPVPGAGAYYGRAPLAERLAQTPAQPVMAESAPPVRAFVEQNHIDQAQWNALVKANQQWVDTLVKVKQSGITSAPGPIDQLARRHEAEVSTILGDAATVEGWKKMQGELTAPRVTVQWAGKTYDGTRVE